MYRRFLTHILMAIMLLVIAAPAKAQRVNVKTNALYWAAATPNLGAEFRVNRHISLNVEAGFHRFKGGKFNTRALTCTPEIRYWFSARPQTGHFLALTALASCYDLRIGDKRHQGDAFGGGLSYGYSFVLSRHWSLETTLGLGAIYRHEKKSDSPEEHAALTSPNISKIGFAPLKAGVTFVYIIK